MQYLRDFFSKLFRNSKHTTKTAFLTEGNIEMTNVIDLPTSAAGEPEAEMIEFEMWMAYDDLEAYCVSTEAEEAAEDLSAGTEGHQQRLVKITVSVPKLVPLEARAE